MIKPDKYTNLDYSVLHVGGLILKSLFKCSIQKYGDLENYVISDLGESAKPVFINALSFLYLVGRVAYQQTTDTIKLIS